MRLSFLAFLLFCQLALPNLASAGQNYDPNEQVLQKIEQRRNYNQQFTQYTAPKETFKPKPVVDKRQKLPESQKRNWAKKQRLQEIETGAGTDRKAETWFSVTKGGTRMAISFNSRPAESAKISDGEVVVNFSAPAIYSPPSIPEKYSAEFFSIAKLSGENLAVKVTFNKALKVVTSTKGRHFYIDLVGAKPDVAAAQAPEKPAAAQAPAEADLKETAENAVTQKAPQVPSQVAQQMLQNQPEAAKTAPEFVRYDKNITVEKAGGVESYIFGFEEKTDAALFERFGNYYLVFYSQDSVGLPDISRSDLFSSVEKVENKDAIIYKFTTKAKVFGTVSRDLQRWKIDFSSKQAEPLRYQLVLRKDGSEWLIDVPAVDKTVEMKDDVTAEKLTIFPSANASEGFKERIVYRDFVIEPSRQGILLRKISEDAKVEYKNSQIRLTPAPQQRRLFEQIPDQDEVGSKKEIIDFKRIAKLEKAVQTLDKQTRRNMGDGAAAMLLFAEGLYKEAAVSAGELVGFDNAMLSSAAYFLAGRYEKAVGDMERVNLPEEKDKNEFFLWLLAAKNELEKRNPSFVNNLQIPDNYALPNSTRSYPPEILSQLLLSLAEVSIARGKKDYAELVLSDFPKKAPKRDKEYAQLLQAKIFALSDMKERASSMWGQLIASSDEREIRAKATYEKTLIDLELKKTNLKQAAQALDDARIVWRGDAFEFKLSTKNAEMYEQLGDYMNALWAYKPAVTLFPDYKENEPTLEKMRQIFKLAMARDFKDLSKSFDALSLYYDFAELKPTGREGEFMTIELAERLVGFDLLEQAIKVLEDFVVNVNDTEERALVYTRIAILYYLLNEPEKSYLTLEKSEDPNMPRYIDIQRRMLFVRTLTAQKRYEEALQSISHIPKQQTAEMKAVIYWHKKDWQAFVDNFAQMQDKSEENVMKTAVALSMLNKVKELQVFREEFLPKMEKGQYAQEFKFIAQPNEIKPENMVESVSLDVAKAAIKDVTADFKNQLKLTDHIKS